jgi:phage baseplate assembly protein W
MANIRTYSDVDLDFAPHPVTHDVSKKLNDDAIRRAVRNLLQTVPFEKKFHPEIGSSLTALLFEPLTNITASLINNEIKETLGNHEPRVRIRTLIVTPKFEENGFSVFLLVEIQNQIAPITINLFLSRLR